MSHSRLLVTRLQSLRLVAVSSAFVSLTFMLACDDAKDAPSDGGGSDASVPDSGPSAPTCKMDADCDDGLYCDGEETCKAGRCEAGTAVTCDDGIACTVDKCSERTKKCSSEAPDGDGDGHGDARCKNKADKVLGDDCDDTDPLRFPGNIESCDAMNKDDDCNPKTFGEKDADDDGFFDAKCCNAESDEKGAKLLCGTDCDDLKASVNPKATEACDLFDNDCDGKTDEGVGVKVYPDKDHDGHGADGSKAVMKCAGSVGFALLRNDCDDGDDEVFDGQFEICDEKDNNCDGNTDELHQDAPWFVDADEDGFGDSTSTPVYSCERIPGRVLSHNDCDDVKPAVNPAAAELCDGVDNDCSGARDFAIGVNDFEDDDNDGIADAKCKPAGKDCDDTDATTGDGKEEVCDTHDNDCDDAIDEDTAQTVWYLDKDGDGWGTDQGTALARCEPIPGRAAALGDCDDDVNAVHPGALETCNGEDDNCNTKTDEGADYQCEVANAVAYCKLGGCAILSCFPGFDNCNKDPKDGCECTKPIAPNANTCLGGTDAECDDHNYCNGKERCIAMQCYDGTPINCSASASVLQGSFSIHNSLDIQMLGGVETITGDLSISAPGLVNLTGLEALKTIGGNLIVDGDLDDDGTEEANKSLTALVGSGLYNLVSVGDQILIEDNSALTVIRLPSLVNAGSITIRNNAALTTLDGFDSLVSVSGQVLIERNPLLSKLSGMQKLASVGSLAIRGNALPEITFKGLTTVHADLDLDGSINESSDDHTTKISLPKLSTVDGSAYFRGWAQLKTLSVPALKTVIGPNLDITNDDLLDDPDFHSLTTLGPQAIGGQQGPTPYLTIANNYAMTTLEHFGAVDCPSQQCYSYIQYNYLLSNCDAQDKLETFTNFASRSWTGNGSNIQSADAGAYCADGAHSVF